MSVTLLCQKISNNMYLCKYNDAFHMFFYFLNPIALLADLPFDSSRRSEAAVVCLNINKIR